MTDKKARAHHQAVASPRVFGRAADFKPSSFSVAWPMRSYDPRLPTAFIELIGDELLLLGIHPLAV